MTSQALEDALGREPFAPVRLNLTDGTAIDIPTPYLSFINRDALYIARARRSNTTTLNVELIALREIAQVVRVPRG